MKWIASFFSEVSQIAQMILIFAAVSLILLIYTHLHIESAIIKRQIVRQTFEKEELLRRNQALHKAISNLNWRAGQKNWQSNLTLPPYKKNKIVKVKLPENLTKER